MFLEEEWGHFDVNTLQCSKDTLVPHLQSRLYRSLYTEPVCKSLLRFIDDTKGEDSFKSGIRKDPTYKASETGLQRLAQILKVWRDRLHIHIPNKVKDPAQQMKKRCRQVAFQMRNEIKIERFIESGQELFASLDFPQLKQTQCSYQTQSRRVTSIKEKFLQAVASAVKGIVKLTKNY